MKKNAINHPNNSSAKSMEISDQNTLKAVLDILGSGEYTHFFVYILIMFTFMFIYRYHVAEVKLCCTEVTFTRLIYLYDKKVCNFLISTQLKAIHSLPSVN